MPETVPPDDPASPQQAGPGAPTWVTPSTDGLSPGVAAAVAKAEQTADDTHPLDTGSLLVALARQTTEVRATVLLRKYGLGAERIATELAGISQVERMQLEATTEGCWTKAARDALEATRVQARAIGAPAATLETLLYALLADGGTVAARVTANCGARPEALRGELRDGFFGDFHPEEAARMTRLKGTLLGSEQLPLFGRDEELERVAAILGRDGRNLPALIGPEGVGKRTITERIAWLVRAEPGRWPEDLAGRFTITADLPAFVADNPRAVTAFVDDADGRFVVYLSSLRALTLSPATTAGIIKPAILSRRLRLILGLTPAEAGGLAGLDPDLLALIDQVNVAELPGTFDEPVTQALVRRYAEVHRVTFTPAAAAIACSLSRRYLRSSAFPGSLAVLLDDVAARKRYAGSGSEVGEADVSAVVSVLSGVPVSTLTESEATRVLSMEEHLHERVIGQDEAVAAVSKAIRRAKAGIKDPKRPVGSFVFLGPTGVGKTELAKALAEFLFGTEAALIQFDMSEYGNEGDVTKLIGSGPQWIGHDEGGQLTNSVRQHPYAVILFDEVEKAHPEIFDVFLQLLEEGRLTDGSGVRVDFANTIVILTSNLGMQHAFDDEATTYEDLKASADAAVHEFFRPELLNRLDAVIVFHPLEHEQVRQICDLLAQALGRRSGVGLTFEQGALDAIVADGYDRRLGARPLRRALSRLVEDPLADLILGGTVARGDAVTVTVVDGKVAITPGGASTGASSRVGDQGG
jgi:ATP-dependent Clp protease ATP-binding subunit ClpC